MLTCLTCGTKRSDRNALNACLGSHGKIQVKSR